LPDEPGLGVQFDPESTRNHPSEPKEQNSLFDEAGALKRP
jgi:galactonate dehydratase